MIHINLLPITERRHKYPLTRIFVNISVVVLVVLVSNYSYGLYHIISMERQLHSLENKYQVLYPTEQKMVVANSQQQLITNKNNVVNTLNKGRIPWYGIVNHLGTVTPEDVKLTEVSLTEKNNLRFKGTAKSYPDIGTFMQLLEKDSFFSEPVLITADATTTLMMANFEISVKLKEM